MVELAKRLTTKYPDISIRYLVYGSMASQEARTKFGTTALVQTLHALAYYYEITESKYKRKLPEGRSFITYKDIPKYIKRPFGIDYDSIKFVERFAHSPYLKVDDFVQHLNELDEYPEESKIKLAKDILKAMYLGEMPLTHAVYLKFFHIDLINKRIQLPEIDILIVDEAQDLSVITKLVIDLFPAKIKIFVGDTYQNIFGFLNTINAFKYYKNATKLSLTTSFRVNSKIASKVEKFMKHHADTNFKFSGIDFPPISDTPRHAYITRTNAELIGKMIELDEQGIPYHLSTVEKIEQMFRIPVAIATLKKDYEENELIPSDPLYDIKLCIHEYNRDEALQRQYEKVWDYILTFPLADEIINSIKLLFTWKHNTIIETAKNAKKHLSTKAKYILCTAHTSKGATFDTVEISDGLNIATDKAIKKLINHYKGINILKIEEIEKCKQEILLYYVACTRAKFKLKNAELLEIDDDENFILSSVINFS